jgi:putative ABC transport system permease protein
MFDYALKNIAKRWVRSLLTVVGVTMTVTLVIVTTGIVDSQKRDVQAHASASAGKIHIQPMLAGTDYPSENVDLPQEVADEILSREGIQRDLSGKTLYLVLEPPRFPSEPPQIVLTGVERGKEEAFTGSVGQDVKPLAGVEFFAASDAEYPLILGLGARAHYGAHLEPGDSLTVLDQEFTIVGVLDSSADKVVNNSLIIPLDIVQGLVDKQGFVSSVILIPTTARGKEEIVAEVQARYPRLHVVTDDHMRRNLVGGIKLFENMISAISVVVVLTASILIMTVVLITVRERTREIGVLRALGAPNGAIIASVFWEIFTLSLAGSLLGGVIAGLVLRFMMMENLFDLEHILKYMPLSIVLTLISGVLPAFKISRILPVESLRYE